MTAIKEERISAYEYIDAIPHNLWARYAFPEPRYGQDTSNINESLNALFNEVRLLPPLQMLSAIWMKTMTTFFDRARKTQRGHQITDLQYYKYVERMERSRRYKVSRSNDGICQVLAPDTGIQYIVNLNDCTCECTNFQEYRSPCSHGIAALLKDFSMDSEEFENPFDYFDRSYQLEFYRLTYASPMPPISIQDLKPDGETLPPIVIKKRGRPKSKRLRKKAAWRKNPSMRKCTTCEEYGHDKRTCRNQPVEFALRQRACDRRNPDDTEDSDIQEALEATDSSFSFDLSTTASTDEAETSYLATIVTNEEREEQADGYRRELEVQGRTIVVEQAVSDKEHAAEQLRHNRSFPTYLDPSLTGLALGTVAMEPVVDNQQETGELQAQIAAEIAARAPVTPHQTDDEDGDDEAEIAADIVSPLKVVRKRGKEKIQALLRSPIALRHRKYK